ncbi:MAG: uridine kinase, partial [Planctomycetota bacterium]
MRDDKRMTTLVGIAGGSGSGKTTLAHEIHRQARTDEVALIPIDSFYHSLRTDQRPEDINYDHPESLDFELLQQCLEQLIEGRAAAVPTYDFATHLRTGTILQVPAPLIVIEGILTLAHAGVRERLHLSVFVQ